MDYEAFTRDLKSLFLALMPRYIGTTHDARETKIKTDGTPVGDLDHEALAELRSLILLRFPADITIGEEDEREEEELRKILNRTEEYQWTIDGLDGTQNDAIGTHGYGAMIARRKGNDILYAAIFLPVDEALRGDGFWHTIK